jgi:predicted transcriptional regulator
MLTEREAQIMDVLWDRQMATADDVRAALAGSPHDSTVRTLLRILETKGFVTHDVQGKTYLYRPAVPREKAQSSALRNFLGRLFRGSAEDLVLRLIEDEVLTPDQLDEIKNSIPPRRTRRRKGGS